MASWKIRGKQLQRGLGQRSTGSVEELLSSKEKKHYTKALKEMHELVKLESLRMHLSKTDPDTEETDYGVQDDEDEIAVEAASQSYLNSDNGKVSIFSIIRTHPRQKLLIESIWKN